jgi:hypothetical protein
MASIRFFLKVFFRSLKLLSILVLMAKPTVYIVSSEKRGKLTPEENALMSILTLVLLISSFGNLWLLGIRRKVGATPYCTYITVVIIKAAITVFTFTPFCSSLVEFFTNDGASVYRFQFFVGVVLLLASVLSRYIRENTMESLKEENNLFRSVSMTEQKFKMSNKYESLNSGTD